MKISVPFRCSLLIFVLCTLGCTRIPTRDREMHFSYLPETPPAPGKMEAVPSYLLDLAADRPEEHHLMLLEIGDDALLTRIHMIRSATKSIDIQTFIWKEDEVTRVIFSELLEAARRGVKVRILVDALNPITGNTRLAQMAVAHPNLEFAVFRPVSFYTEPGTINTLENLTMKMRRLNRRMHNKLILADDAVGIVGGRNYENKYFDRSQVMVFKDRDVLVTGPTVAHMDLMFETFWEHKDSVYLTQFKDVQNRLPLDPDLELEFEYESDRDSMQQMLQDASAYNPAALRDSLQITQVKRAGFFWDPPGKFKRGRNKYENQYGQIIREVVNTANGEVLLQSPYLIYHRRSKKLIREMRKDHPDLAIWFSSNSLAAADHDVVYGVSFKHRKKLYKTLGLEIFEFAPYPRDLLKYVPRYPELCGLTAEEIEADLKRDVPLRLLASGPKLTIHAKTFVVDSTFVQIGSHNFDPRSSSLNSECGLIVEDETFTRLVKQHILNDVRSSNSWMVAKKNDDPNVLDYINGFFMSISNMLPIFDVWPYTYTSNFELIEGQEPLKSSRHPEFYERYRDVGQFPMVEKAMGKMKAKFMKGFGGWTGPFM